MISEADFQRMQLRCQGVHGKTPATREAAPEEKGLHEEILLDCRNRMWPVIHSRMDVPSTIGVGAPDLIIFASGGRIFIIECKSKTGKMSTEQLAWKMVLERNGHTYHLVRSFNEYLDVISEKPKA